MDIYVTWVQEVLAAHPVLAPAIFLLLRSVPVFVAVIPGLALDLIALSIFGWQLGFILAEAGLLLGALIAFYIARFFREPLVRKFVALEKVHEIENRFSEKQKFWGLVLIRIGTLPLFDLVSYAAGLTRLSVWTYAATTFLGTFPVMLGIYYFGGFFAERGPWMIALFALLIVAVIGASSILSNQKYIAKIGQIVSRKGRKE